MSRQNRDVNPGLVTFKKPSPGHFPHYELPGDQLSHGASLGNRHLWVNTRSTGHIQDVFCNSVGRNLFGSLIVTYAIPTKTLLMASPSPDCRSLDETAYIHLEPDGAGIACISSFWQQRDFDLSGGLHITESVLVPKMVEADPPLVLQHIEITNASQDEVVVLITVHVDMKGDLGDDLVVNFNDDIGALEIYNESHPEWARLVGAETCGIAYRTTRDVSSGYAGTFTRRISSEPLSSPGPFGELQLELHASPGATATATIVAVVSTTGIGEAREWYEKSLSFEDYLNSTNKYLTPVVAISSVETPDPIINQGVSWAKVNMLKVMANYPEGPSFTNEPGKSTNVVGRDVAWFVYGCDFLDQEFSKQMLLQFARKQYPSGKIPEYYNALDGRVEDYGLSLNDDTPLYVLACRHHYSLTHDRDFLEMVYPGAKLAAEYILKQRDDRGLVISVADGREVWGISSWRNVIPDYQINGAVTEINSECYAALQAVAELCADCGDSADAERFTAAGDQLKVAINTHLLNPDNGLYYLNIDSSGMANTDVTADEVFPVLFDVAPPEVANRIISRLRADDFMTSAGLRTVSRNSPDYEPTKLVGLKGGVWPGVAFWYAFAAAAVYPEFMVDSLRASYLQYLIDPLKNNTVPGQFSEWFDGNSLVNRGMRLSPWEPPRLLWAAVQGMCGVKAGDGKLFVSPINSARWKWLGLRRMPYWDGFFTYFATFEDSGVQIYSNKEVDTPYELHVAGEDVTNRAIVSDYRVHRAVFLSEQGLTLCLGTESDAYTTVNVKLRDLLKPDAQYSLRVYSRASGWIDAGNRTGAELSEIAMSIEDGEFRIITMTMCD